MGWNGGTDRTGAERLNETGDGSRQGGEYRGGHSKVEEERKQNKAA